MDNDYIIQLITKLDGSKTADDLKKIEQQLNAKGINLKTSLDTATSKQQLQELAKQLQSVLKSSGLEIDTSKIMSAFTQIAREMQNINKLADQKKIDSLAESILKFRDNNTKMSKDLRKQFTNLYGSLVDGSNLTEKEVKELTQQFVNLKLQVREAGMLGQSFGDKMKNAFVKFSEWGFATGIVTKFTSEINGALTELKELDSILTEITKTSDLTEQQLKKLGDTAFDTASKYGKTASNYLTGIQEMYRAGFDNAEQMAELSVLAQSAGDMETNTANDYLMATNAAYDFKGSAEALNKVLDSQNYITNNAAVSMQDMADATSQAASVASQYGVEIDELSALIAVATSKTRESGSEVGTALKSIFVNLQDTTNSTITKAFDSVGVSMTKMVNGSEQLKTPIELIKELSEVYNSLPEGDTRRATILSDIGTKYHANTFAAILSDLESYNEMMELYNSTSADGSAFREAEKSANNLEGSLNRLNNTITDIVDNILSSDLLTNGVNLLNNVLTVINEMTDALGSWGTIAVGGTGVGIYQIIKNLDCQMTLKFCQ